MLLSFTATIFIVLLSGTSVRAEAKNPEACCVRTIGYWKNHLSEWTQYHNNTIECCDWRDEVVWECFRRPFVDILQFKRNDVRSDAEWRWVKLSRQYAAAFLNRHVLNTESSQSPCEGIIRFVLPSFVCLFTHALTAPNNQHALRRL